MQNAICVMHPDNQFSFFQSEQSGTLLKIHFSNGITKTPGLYFAPHKSATTISSSSKGSLVTQIK